MMYEVRFVDVYTNKPIFDTIILKHKGQTYDIPEGYDLISKENIKNIETVILRKIKK